MEKKQLNLIGMELATFDNCRTLRIINLLPLWTLPTNSNWIIESIVIETMINSIPTQWKSIFQQYNVWAPIGDKVGYSETKCQDAYLVANFQPTIDECPWAPVPPPTLQCFQVSTSTCIVDMDSPKEFDNTIKARWCRLVRICTIDKGENKPSFNA